MMEVSIVGLDLAKRVFQFYAARSDGSVVLRRELSRGHVVTFFTELPQCTVALSLKQRPGRRCVLSFRRLNPSRPAPRYSGRGTSLSASERSLSMPFAHIWPSKASLHRRELRTGPCWRRLLKITTRASTLLLWRPLDYIWTR